jgi:ATP-binding cassette subfamily B protein
MIIIKLLRLTRGAGRQILIKALIGLLILGTYIAQAFAVSGITRSIFLGDGARASFYLGALAFIGIMLAARTLLMWSREVFSKIAAAKVKEQIRLNMFRHLFNLGPACMEDDRTGKTVSIFTDGVESMEAFLIDYIPQALVTVMGLGILMDFMLRLDPVVGMVVFAAVLIALTTPLYWDRLMTRLGRGHWNAYGDLNAQFIDAMQGMTTLKILGANRIKAEELKNDSAELFKATMSNLKVSLISSAMMGLASAAGSSLAIGIGAWRVLAGTLEPARLFIILFLASECFRPTTDLNTYFHQAFLGITVSRQLFAFMEREPEARNRPLAGASRKSGGPEKLPEIRFSGVTFGYRKGLPPALRDLSFTIESGQTMALVGKSGTGKSTIMNLFLRFYEVQGGHIFIGGQDIAEISLEELRSKIAVVFQDAYLFYGTVLDNLLVARSAASREEAVEAAKLANAQDFISALPDGYDTIIGERGTRLSGGERQRIAIARAILKGAPFLILDEATSHVDGAGDRLIQEGLAQLMEKHTSLIIAHRLSTIRNAGHILALGENGEWESGTAEALLRRDGVYARLVKAGEAALTEEAC